MKNVFLKVYSKVNLGDDLFIKILLDRYPTIKFNLIAPEVYQEIFKDYNNLVVVPKVKKSVFNRISGFILRKTHSGLYRGFLRKHVKEELSRLPNHPEAFISVGGSIFMQPEKLPYYLDHEYYEMIDEVFNDIPKLYLGGNFGPYNDPKYKTGYDRIFGKAYDVCFREEYSYNLFKKLKNIRYAPDIVFGLKDLKRTIDSKSIGFSIVPSTKATKDIDSQDYINNYTNLISKFIVDGYKIKLFSFCKEEGDEDIINAICQSLVHVRDKLEVIKYDGNIDNFLNIYKSCEVMFCGRFHAMILSLLYRQMVFPIIYSEKMKNVLDDIGYQGPFEYIGNIGDINYDTIVSKLMNSNVNIQDVMDRAELHFEKLDELIKGKNEA